MLEAISEQNNVRLTIVSAGQELGYYLYVFDLYEKSSKADHLCDNLQQAYYIAKEDYNISKEDFSIVPD